MSKTPQAISNFAVQSPLDVATVEFALNELLAAVRDDQVPATAVDQMHDYYDRYITWQNHFLHHFAPFVRDVDRCFNPQSTQPHLLDLGCGVATQAHLLAMRGATITGLDHNPQRVAAGQAMTPWFSERSGKSLHVTLQAADAFEMLAQQPAESFDGCYTQFALAYMRPHREMLELIHRVVRPGGRILFREFNAGSLYNRVISRVDWLTDRDYQDIGKELGWQCLARDYCWFVPKQLTNPGQLRHWWGRFEAGLERISPVARYGAAAMTLVFQR